MSEYTPTEEEVRDVYSTALFHTDHKGHVHDQVSDGDAEFDRFIASVRGSARVQPTQDEIAKVLHENFNSARGRGGVSPQILADTILTLLSSTPRVAQAQAQALLDFANGYAPGASGSTVKLIRKKMRSRAEELDPYRKEEK